MKLGTSISEKKTESKPLMMEKVQKRLKYEYLKRK
jgi:hypothetical protein